MSVEVTKPELEEQQVESAARPVLALLALALAALLAVLDGTVVTVALHSLSSDLDAPLTTIVWVTIGYLLAAASMLPLLGWAMARFGGRAVFLTGLGLFVLGSVLSALAWSAPALIAFRVLQGFGGGLLEPTALTLAAAMAGRDRVGKVLGTMSMIINIAPVLGPIVGELLLKTGHWQWIFLINIPLGGVVLLMTLAFVPANRPDPTLPRPSADLRGLALLSVGFVAILFALNRSGQTDVGPVIVLSAVTGATLLALYTRYALRATTPPPFDLRLLRRPGFGAALGTMGIVGFVMFSLLTALPLFAEQHDAVFGLREGVLVVGLGLGLFVSMSTGGRASDRTGPRPLVRAGSIGTAVGLGTFAIAHDDLSQPVLFALFVGIGLSFGLTAAPSFASVYRILPVPEQPQGTTALFMTVQFTASLGVTTLSLLQARAGDHWLTVLFAILAVGALAQTVISRALPGAPAQAAAGSSRRVAV